MLRSVPSNTKSFPNVRVDPEAGWDAYIWVSDADGLYKEFQKRGATIVQAPKVEHGRKQFEVADSDGYVLAIGQATGR